jgi:hypothetical protein
MHIRRGGALDQRSKDASKKVSFQKFEKRKLRKKEKTESSKTSVQKNTLFSVLMSQNALKTPRLRPVGKSTARRKRGKCGAYIYTLMGSISEE